MPDLLQDLEAAPQPPLPDVVLCHSLVTGTPKISVASSKSMTIEPARNAGKVINATKFTQAEPQEISDESSPLALPSRRKDCRWKAYDARHDSADAGDAGPLAQDGAGKVMSQLTPAPRASDDRRLDVTSWRQNKVVATRDVCDATGAWRLAGQQLRQVSAGLCRRHRRVTPSVMSSSPLRSIESAEAVTPDRFVTNETVPQDWLASSEEITMPDPVCGGSVFDTLVDLAVHAFVYICVYKLKKLVL